MHTKKSITTSLPIQDLDEGKYRGQWLVIAGATGAIPADSVFPPIPAGQPAGFAAV